MEEKSPQEEEINKRKKIPEKRRVTKKNRAEQQLLRRSTIGCMMPGDPSRCKWTNFLTNDVTVADVTGHMAEKVTVDRLLCALFSPAHTDEPLDYKIHTL